MAAPPASPIYQTPHCLPNPPADEKQHPPLKCAEGFVSNLSSLPGNFPFMVACYWVLFFLFKADRLLAVRWMRGLKYSKKKKNKHAIVIKGKIEKLSCSERKMI